MDLVHLPVLICPGGHRLCGRLLLGLVGLFVVLLRKERGLQVHRGGILLVQMPVLNVPDGHLNLKS